ncbi:hypothetical protein FD28_GL001448 [Levilactobacillus hammesii DSM 16381]|uniref:Uncharacterized protein n=1 Tax=Levilactobacillus hammesii DSM 16381 TaxID=1423753 RepID=A0A0R1UJM5_9LACO|nr:hypothetical protein FD28_GL001448 [Levilactobacillus hammesii DSM 16381]
MTHSRLYLRLSVIAAQLRHSSDDPRNKIAKICHNRRRPEMEAAVTTVLADFRLTAWDAFGDRRSLPGFKPSRRTVPQAAGGPHSSRNLWQPQVNCISDLTGLNLVGGNPECQGLENLMQHYHWCTVFIKWPVSNAVTAVLIEPLSTDFTVDNPRRVPMIAGPSFSGGQQATPESLTPKVLAGADATEPHFL